VGLGFAAVRSGFAAVLEGLEFGFETVEGGLVVFALLGDAFEEAGFFGVASCEIGHGDTGGGGSVGVFVADFGDGGVGDDAV
jgi:hypothetical protein